MQSSADRATVAVRGNGPCDPKDRASEGRHECESGLNLTRSAAEHPDRTAVRLDDVTVSYRALADASARVSGLLRRRGVGPGDRVGIMLPNVPEFAAIYYGILQAGAVVVPMNVLLKKREVAFYLGDPDAKLVFAWRDFAEDATAGADEAGAACVLLGPRELGAAARGHRHQRQGRRSDRR